MKHIAMTALLLSPTTLAAAYSELFQVYPLEGDRFEVIATQGPAAGDYWCGAARHAIAELRKPATQRIYVVRGRGDSQARPDRRAVQFAFTPPAGGPVQSQSISVDIVGNQMSAAQAQAFCMDRTVKD